MVTLRLLVFFADLSQRLVGRGPTIASADSWVSHVYPYLFLCTARFLQCLIDQSVCCVQAEGCSSRRSYLVRLEPDWSCVALSTVTSLLSSGRSMVMNCLVEGKDVSTLARACLPGLDPSWFQCVRISWNTKYSDHAYEPWIHSFLVSIIIQRSPINWAPFPTSNTDMATIVHVLCIDIAFHYRCL